jgi:predicted PurR-regulated permease PerM
VGLFLGPVILAVLMAVWREWLEDSNLVVPAHRLNDAALRQPEGGSGDRRGA